MSDHMTTDNQQGASAPLSAATLERFAREVAKYPEAGKQSAVMACLAIVQQDEGSVSLQREREIAAYLGMAPVKPMLSARSGVTTPMPTVRCFQMRLSVSSVSYSST